jgi:demethylspheroidene O-methyltransferase
MSPLLQPARPGLAAILKDHFNDWRNRIVENPRFQRFAARSPFTRRIAAHKARALFDLCAGFVYSQVLQACVRLDLFEMLARKPLALADVAARCDLHPERALRLLRAAVSLELLRETADGRFGLGELGAALRGNPGVAAMIRHHAMLYADLADPVALLKAEQSDTALSRYWAYASDEMPGAAGADSVAAYTELMARSQGFVAEDVLDSVNIAKARRIMDLGGGSGVFLTHVARRAPKAALTLFDLPAVVEQARLSLPPSLDITLVGGDFTRDALPAGHDLITLIRIAHDHDDNVVEALLARIHAALVPGGVVLIGEPLAGQKGTEPMADAYFGFYFLAMGQGRARRPAELQAMLVRAGFADIRIHTTPRPLMTGLVTARKKPIS